MTRYDDGRDVLQTMVADWVGATERTRNEAGTRLELVDRLLFDCLGWQKPDCELEVHLDGGVADYVLGRPRVVVVEAKRESVELDLPAGTSGNLRLSSLADPHQQLVRAFAQITRYCSAAGVPIGVFANGHQIVAFLGVRTDGKAPVNGQAAVFRSLEEMHARFHDLWNFLSPQGVRERHLHRHLRVIDAEVPPPKLRSRIRGYPRPATRTPLQSNLTILADALLDETNIPPAEEEAFVRATYCPTSEVSQFARQSAEDLKARYHAIERFTGVSVLPVVVSEDGVEGMGGIGLATLAKKPTLLVGDVGVGKTTFIRYLTTIATGADLFRNALTIYLDLGSEPALLSSIGELNDYIQYRIIEQLRRDYAIDIDDAEFVRTVYAEEIESFSRSPLAGSLTDAGDRERQMMRRLSTFAEDRSRHLTRSLHHLNIARSPVIVFLDNADQRPREWQDQVFLTAEGLARNHGTIVFVPLRPETIASSKRSGAMTGYLPRAYSIFPPRVNEVIVKRLRYVLRRLTHSDAPMRSSFEGVDLQELVDYLEVCAFSFTTNPQLSDFMENASRGNIRASIDLLRQFLGSANIDTAKILRIHRDRGYTIPLHEFIRAVMFGEYRDYLPDSSPLPNVFDLTANDAREHFLLLLLLRVVESLAPMEGQAGFVPTDTLIAVLQAYGFVPPQIDYALLRCRDKGLLEPTDRQVETDVEDVEAWRVTAAGRYAPELPKRFAYIDGVIPDTPILDAEDARGVAVDAEDIQDRFNRAFLFRAYLMKAWVGADLQESGFDWLEIDRALGVDLQETERRIERFLDRRVREEEGGAKT